MLFSVTTTGDNRVAIEDFWSAVHGESLTALVSANFLVFLSSFHVYVRRTVS